MELTNTRVILASQSPRRKELLARILPEFEIIPSQDEERPTEIRPSRVVMELARMKARDVYEKVVKETPDGRDILVIGADTIVSLNGNILGKPEDHEDARRMLSLLSGKDHEVFTGVTLVYKKAGETNTEENTFFEQTTVTFYPLEEAELKALSESPEPMDKAGAYAIQGEAGVYISRVNGDIMNVIGLPVPRLVQELKKLKT